MKDILNALMDDSDPTESDTHKPVSHPGFTVEQPFSVLRYLLVSIITQIVLLDG